MTCIGLLRGGRPVADRSGEGAIELLRIILEWPLADQRVRRSRAHRGAPGYARTTLTSSGPVGVDLGQRRHMTVDCGVRSLLIAVLASLGLVALAADHGPSWKLDRQVAECVPRPGSSADLAERAPRLPAPMRVVARTGRTSPAARPTGGCAGLHGERSVDGMHVARVAPVSGADPPPPGDGLQRRQPEGRAPPMGPSAA
jgi:hypothetical protein